MATTPLLRLLETRKRLFIVEQAFDDLFSYSQFSEVALIERAAMHEAEGAISDIFYPDQVTDDDIERFQNERRQLRAQFPQSLRAAVLSLTHSIFESQFAEIARHLATQRGITVPENVRTVWPAKKLLERDLGLTFVAQDWEQFKAYQTVRNSLVHNEGRIDLPLKDGSDVSAAALCVGAEIHELQLRLTRVTSADFVLLCRRICVSILRPPQNAA